MKSYLSLIPISAKVRKRQNRMMILCIIISVLLVTTIFSAADMIIRGETVTMQAIQVFECCAEHRIAQTR